jgi:hypothetical protein
LPAAGLKKGNGESSSSSSSCSSLVSLENEDDDEEEQENDRSAMVFSNRLSAAGAKISWVHRRWFCAFNRKTYPVEMAALASGEKMPQTLPRHQGSLS